MQRERAPETQHERLHPEPVESLDAHRVVTAAHAQEDGLTRAFVDALHHGQCGLPLVEPCDYRAAEPKQPPAEPVRARTRACLDHVERLQPG